MKKNLLKLTLTLALFSTIIVILLVFRSTDKKKYRKNAEKLKEQYWGGDHIIPLDVYFDKYYEAPINLNELSDIVQDYLIIPDDTYTDPFSSKGNNLLYIPIYNPINLKRESILLISAGIDGNINNRYQESDTIFTYMVNDIFKLYNNPIDIETPRYHLFNRLFGKKDFAIMYENLTERYKNIRVFDTIVDFSLFINQFDNDRIFNPELYKKYLLKLNDKELIKSDSCRLSLKSGDFSMYFKLYDCNDTDYILEKENNYLTCRLDGYNHEKGELSFVLCYEP